MSSVQDTGRERVMGMLGQLTKADVPQTNGRRGTRGTSRAVRRYPPTESTGHTQ